MYPATPQRAEDERLPVGRSIAYGLQHVLTMYGGLIAPPLIVGGAAGLPAPDIAVVVSASIFVSGLATLLQSLGLPYLGAKLPIVQGTSFAGVSTMVAIAGGDGIRTVFGAVIVAGIVGIAVAPVFGQVVRMFPPVVTGSVITVIGLSLLPVAFGWIVGDDAGDKDYGSPRGIALAGMTLVAFILVARVFQGALSGLAILVSITTGTGIALAMGVNQFGSVTHGAMIAAPPLLHFGAPHFHPGAIAAMVVVILVIMTEATADLLAVGEIVGSPVGPRRLADGLRADMASSTVAAVLNSFPCSAFAENIGLVASTKIKSRFVVAWGGAMLAVLGLLPVVGRLVAAVPLPVLGGAGIVLFGSVCAAGIRTLGRVDYDGNANLVVVAISVGLGVIPIATPRFWGQFPSWVQMIMNSGISSAAIAAVALNLVFNGRRGLRAPAGQ
jgi:xanthine permease